jgi:hypothetical protein
MHEPSSVFAVASKLTAIDAVHPLNIGASGGGGVNGGGVGMGRDGGGDGKNDGGGERAEGGGGDCKRPSLVTWDLSDANVANMKLIAATAHATTSATTIHPTQLLRDPVPDTRLAFVLPLLEAFCFSIGSFSTEAPLPKRSAGSVIFSLLTHLDV